MRSRRQTATARQAEVRDRENEALRLRRDHVPLQQIADFVGYPSAGVAGDAVNRALRRTLVESADEFRQLEFARLDRYAQTAMAIMVDPDTDPKLRLQAVDRLLRLSEQRMRYAGLLTSSSAEVNLGMGMAMPAAVEARPNTGELLGRDDPERLFKLLDAFARAGKIEAQGGLGVLALDAATAETARHGVHAANGNSAEP